MYVFTNMGAYELLWKRDIKKYPQKHYGTESYSILSLLNKMSAHPCWGEGRKWAAGSSCSAMMTVS